MKLIETDVLVVGAGPTGLAAAALLGRAGVDVVSLSRYSGPAPQPRASFTNQRTMEVFRDLDIEDRMMEVAYSGRAMGHNVMATSLTGMEVMRFATYGTGDRLTDYAQASPTEYVLLPQHVMEPVMLDRARELGAKVEFYQDVLDIQQADEYVTARVRNRNDGEEYTIRAQYVIGADGARSVVADKIGFSFEGEAAPVHMINAWIEADLTEYIVNRPAGLYILFQPGGNSWVGSGSLAAVKPSNEWLLIREFDVAQGDPDRSDEAIVAAARALIGVPDLAVRVKGTGIWQVNNMIARTFRRGRVFIAGDAAHRHSPAGGLGTNTSIQDSFNLAWKLSYVLKGLAGEALLDSYDQERQPVGHEVVERSMSNLRNKSAIADAIGLVKGQGKDEAWDALNTLFTDHPGAAERRARLAEVRALQHQRSNAHGIFLGQRYTSCAVVDDGTPFPKPDRDPAVFYHPTTHPGARLPHVWVERGGQRYSTLDLAGHDRFCLIVGIGGAPWVAVAADVAAEFGIDLVVAPVGYRCEYDDPLGDWERVREIDDHGALLVRPDQHVAWRSHSRSETPREVLSDALREALGFSLHNDAPRVDRRLQHAGQLSPSVTGGQDYVSADDAVAS